MSDLSSPLLPLLGLLGAAMGLNHAVRGRGNASNARSGRKVRSKRVTSSGATGMVPTRRSDLSIRPPSMTNVPQKVPSNIPTALFWTYIKYDQSITSSTTAVTETNFSFSLSQNPESASLVALFDQYAVIQATVKFESTFAPGATSSPAKLYTALDFDNTNPVGSVTAIEEFATCEELILQPWATHLRSVNPTPKTSAGSTGSAAPVRTWIDCAVPSTPHFGIRSLIGVSSVVEAVACTITVVYCFRNQI